MILKIFKRREWASPLVQMKFSEQILTAGASSAAFFVVAPVMAGAVGTYFGCTTVGCSLATSAMSGATSGASAAAVGGGLGTYFVKTNTKNWLKQNAGKKIINSSGKVEIVRGLAFIAPAVVPVMSPSLSVAAKVLGKVPQWSLYVVPSAYAFTCNFISARKKSINK
jgi:hypothetical protein